MLDSRTVSTVWRGVRDSCRDRVVGGRIRSDRLGDSKTGEARHREQDSIREENAQRPRQLDESVDIAEREKDGRNSLCKTENGISIGL